ncbi:N-acetylmuramoyl-L-alanine amidase [Rubellimicrobium roseum]|uniref:N-acetylmuramoyl-L-alanine amidase n=1 Tax=Rubellimicrobium roseum TaxID=687525 RepID=A0A5C4N9T8_9RHOB|nr:N-acetylmuramoyl-L-alanine amidase [Rubellimicrobium roseum]TNC71373.1 N-acetylmuramoyl-L-alanine amidase [Rubellimicrobium roseum]
MGWLGRAALALAVMAGPAAAEAPARVEAEGSRIADRGWSGGIEVELALSRAVPWRVFTLDEPPRLVVDFRGLDWTGVEAEALLEAANAIGVSFGAMQAGWSRLVVALGGPAVVAEAGMQVDEGTGAARLRLRLDPTDEASFAARSGAPADEGWAPPAPEPAPPPPEDRFVVAIDPGHGGIDPGAEREGLREAHLMLALGQELAAALGRAGIEAVLTREADVFVPLQDRVTLARAGSADVLISLHADALEEDSASGASVYTLTDEAVGEASRRMVERHGSGDLIAGLDLTGQDDAVATALMDLARLDTAPASLRLAETLARELGRAGAPVNGHALRQAQLAVLNAADFPSVLLEAGFLSDAGDRARLSRPEGRAPIVRGIVAALRAWSEAEAQRAGLLRR